MVIPKPLLMDRDPDFLEGTVTCLRPRNPALSACSHTAASSLDAQTHSFFKLAGMGAAGTGSAA